MAPLLEEVGCLDARAVLAGLHLYFLPPSSELAQKAGRLAIGVSWDAFFRWKDTGALRGLSGHPSPDVSENRRDQYVAPEAACSSGNVGKAPMAGCFDPR